MDLKKEITIGKLVAIKAGKKILEIYNENQYEVISKSDSSPVTEADLQANDIIVKMLKSEFPEDGFLSEEIEDDGSRISCKRFWLIDPLDGTKEFVKRNGEFTVNIALVENNELILGIIYIPVNGDLYYASKDNGAYKIENDIEKRIKVSANKKKLNLLDSRSHRGLITSNLIEIHKNQIEKFEVRGSSLKGCLIAEGKFDAYYNFGTTMKWDTGAMEMIVKEAGGVLKRPDKEDIDYGEDKLENDGFFIVNDIDNLWI